MYAKQISVSQNIFLAKKLSKGFSFVEVLFAVTIGLMVLGMLSIFYVEGVRLTTLDLALAEINSDARLVMDKILRDARWAVEVETSRAISGTTYVTANDELVLEIPAIDSSGNIISGTSDYVVYTLDASNPSILRRVVDPHASSSRTSKNEIVAQNVSVFFLTSGGTGLSSVGSLSTVSALGISITVAKQPLPGRTVDKTLISDVKLRNT